MPGYLRQSTAAQSRALGPFVSDTDFKTVQTALTIANTDIKLIVNGGASANKNSGGGTHRANGVYGVTFDATDTATVGEMEVSVVVAGALVVFDKFFVLEEAVYDALFAASAPGYGTAQTGDSYALANGVNGFAAIKTQTAAIEVDTGTDIPAILATIAAYIDTEVGAIKAKTDNLPAAPAAVGDIPTAVQNADALLGRNVSGGSSSGRTVKQALHFLRNKFTVSGGVLTVYDTDDTTTSWTGAVTSTAGADPITGNDPT